MTSPHASATHCATAILADVSSPPALNANEKGRLVGALSHGHSAHAGVHDQPQGSIGSMVHTAILSVWPLLPVLNWRGVRLASFSRISHWLPSSSRAADRRVAKTSLQVARLNLRERAVTGCASPFIPRVVGCTRSRAHSVPAEQFLQCIAHRDHHSIALSKPRSLAGSINASKSGHELGNIIRPRGTIVQGTRRHD